MRTIYREKRYICGEYLDVYIFPAYRCPGSHTKRGKPTSEGQKKLNERHSQEQIVRLFHANFTEDDIELHLTYKIQPESADEAKRDIQNFIRRLRRLRKKLGLPDLKYICVTEQSGKGRYHHHITVNGGIDRDMLEKLWGFGYANSRRLQFSENGLEGLGKYITKAPIFSRRWNRSKNLIDPKPITRDGRISGHKAKELACDTTNNSEYENLYPGYCLAEAEAFYNDVNGGRYIFARFYRKDGRFMKPKRRRDQGQWDNMRKTPTLPVNYQE